MLLQCVGRSEAAVAGDASAQAQLRLKDVMKLMTGLRNDWTSCTLRSNKP